MSRFDEREHCRIAARGYRRIEGRRDRALEVQARHRDNISRWRSEIAALERELGPPSLPRLPQRVPRRRSEVLGEVAVAAAEAVASLRQAEKRAQVRAQIRRLEHDIATAEQRIVGLARQTEQLLARMEAEKVRYGAAGCGILA